MWGPEMSEGETYLFELLVPQLVHVICDPVLSCGGTPENLRYLVEHALMGIAEQCRGGGGTNADFVAMLDTVKRRLSSGEGGTMPIQGHA